MYNSLLYYQTIFRETIKIAKTDEEMVNHILNMIGVSQSLIGFEYLKSAILLLLKKDDFYNIKVVSELYPAIANDCGVEKYKNVERGITKAKEKLFLKKKAQINKEILIWVLGILNEDYTMTNSDFIFAITRFIKENKAIEYSNK